MYYDVGVHLFDFASKVLDCIVLYVVNKVRHKDALIHSVKCYMTFG